MAPPESVTSDPSATLNARTSPSGQGTDGPKKGKLVTTAAIAAVLISAAAYGVYRYSDGASKANVVVAGKPSPGVSASTLAEAGPQYEQALSLVTEGYRSTGRLPPVAALAADNKSRASAGDTDAQNSEKIGKLLNQAATAGHPQASYLLAMLLNGFDRSEASADAAVRSTRLLKQAADKGLFLAQYDAVRLTPGVLPRDETHYQSAQEAANAGFAPAQVHAALSANGPQRTAWFEKALVEQRPAAVTDPLIGFRNKVLADRKDQFDALYIGIGQYAYAMDLLGAGDTGNAARAHALVRDAAKLGIPAATLADAKMRISGQGGTQRPAEGAAILTKLSREKPAEISCSKLFPECAASYIATAQYLLALNHFGQTPGFAGITDGIAYLQLAASSGNTDAKSLLGWALLQGMETPADPSKAFALLTDASDAGVIDAKYWLAKCYIDGKGTQPDTAKARALLSEAASAGHIDAQKLLQKI